MGFCPCCGAERLKEQHEEECIYYGVNDNLTKDCAIQRPVEEQVKEAFDNGALAVTTINGKMSPWTPFGMSHDQELAYFKKYAEQRRKEKEAKKNESSSLPKGIG